MQEPGGWRARGPRHQHPHSPSPWATWHLVCVWGVQHEGVGVQKSQSRESDGAVLGCRGQGDRGGSVFEETAAGRGGASPGPLDSATRATRPVCAYAREVALAGHHATGGLGGATFRAPRASDGTHHTEGAQSPGAEGQRPPGPCWPRGGGEDGSGRAAASGVVTRRRPPSAAHTQLPPGTRRGPRPWARGAAPRPRCRPDAVPSREGVLLKFGPCRLHLPRCHSLGLSGHRVQTHQHAPGKDFPKGHEASVRGVSVCGWECFEGPHRFGVTSRMAMRTRLTLERRGASGRTVPRGGEPACPACPAAGPAPAARSAAPGP